MTFPPDASLLFYVVYRDPSDFPGMHVVRRQWAVKGHVVSDSLPLIVCANYDQAIAVLPLGLYRQPRHPGDDPAILEMWF